MRYELDVAQLLPPDLSLFLNVFAFDLSTYNGASIFRKFQWEGFAQNIIMGEDDSPIAELRGNNGAISMYIIG
jgi:hypothetical protein